MKKKFIYPVITILLLAQSIFGQEQSGFTPYFKPLVLVFSDVNTTLSKDGSSKGFEITRTYVGFEYFFSEKISSRVNLDVGDPGVGKLQMTAYVKNAYLMYRSSGFSARFGLIGTDEFNVQEKVWGYRYIYKSFQDAYGFGPSADLGAALDEARAKARQVQDPKSVNWTQHGYLLEYLD